MYILRNICEYIYIYISNKGIILVTLFPRHTYHLFTWNSFLNQRYPWMLLILWFLCSFPSSLSYFWLYKCIKSSTNFLCSKIFATYNVMWFSTSKHICVLFNTVMWHAWYSSSLQINPKWALPLANCSHVKSNCSLKCHNCPRCRFLSSPLYS